MPADPAEAQEAVERARRDLAREIAALHQALPVTMLEMVEHRADIMAAKARLARAEAALAALEKPEGPSVAVMDAPKRQRQTAPGR